jgi:hypothetical protein
MSGKFFFGAANVTALAIAFAVGIYAQNAPDPPRVFVLNGKSLQAVKRKFSDARTADPWSRAALAKLERDAQKALKTEQLTVTSKTSLPPSGSKHDYTSRAPYYWKNPDTKDGLPYIRKDGERNPEIKNFPDHDLMDRLADAVMTLSAAYYFTEKEEYASKAAELLRTWFLDPTTLMNPKLEFAQAVPGKNDGRGTGILESRALVRVVDAIGLLKGSRSWTKADQTGLESWFAKYYAWITTSPHGKDEAAAKNNHGTWYDVQITSFALFLGKTDDARKILENAKQKRIAAEIEPDGKQLLELARTNSWGYSTMNLDAFITLAELGENVGVDLWTFHTSDGRGIRKAIEFLYPFTKPDRKWPYQQIDPLDPNRLYTSMRRASRKYNDQNFEKAMGSVPALPGDDRSSLLAR